MTQPFPPYPPQYQPQGAPQYQQPFPQQQQQPGAPQYQPPQGANLAAMANMLRNAQMGNAQGRYLPAGGDFVAAVGSVEIKQTRKGTYFILGDLTIEESDHPDVRPGDGGYSVLYQVDHQYDYDRNAIKEWVCLWIESVQPGSNPGVYWSEKVDQFLALVTDASQPARGSRWHVHTWAKPPGAKSTRTTPITIHDWRPLAAGESLGLQARQPAPAPQAAAPTAPTFGGAPTPGQAPAQAPQAPAQAPPPGWPSTLPYPPGGGQ